MDNVVPIRRDTHEEVVRLLPWFVTGSLDDDERAAVESHLAGCAECRSELVLEQRLAAEIVAMPSEAEPGWEAMARRLDAPAKRKAKARKPTSAVRTVIPWLGWAIAAQILLVIGVRALTPAPAPNVPVYHALAVPAARPPVDIAVIFRPGTTEAEVRSILEASHARVSDGPTAAGAWMLSTPNGSREAALASLRARPQVLIAQPVDGP